MSQNSEVLQHILNEEIYSIPGKIIIILPGAWSAIKRAELSLLDKILNAVKLTLNQVRVIEKTPVDLNELTVFSPTVVISFGSEINQVSKHYEILNWNGIAVLKADPLSELDEPRKKRLWEALRKMFSIS